MKVLVCCVLLCVTFFSSVLSRASQPVVQGYLTPTTGKWLYPDEDDQNPDSQPPQVPGTPTATNPTNVQIVEQMLAGFSQQANLGAPSNIKQCLDEESAMTINGFFYSIINKLANSDFMTVPIRIRAFEESLSPSVLQCLKTNQDIQNLMNQYGVRDMSLNAFYYKLANYTYNGNYQALVDQASSIRSAYETQQYQNAGSLAGKLLQAITNFQPQVFSPLKSAFLYYSPFAYLAQTYSIERKKVLLNSVTSQNTTFQDLLDSDDDISDDSGQEYKINLRNLFRGIATNAKLKEKVANTIVSSCFSEEDAKLSLDSMAQGLTEITEKNIYNVPDTVDNLRNNLSPSTTDCISSSPEVQKLLKAYDLDGKNMTYVYNKVDAYILTNGYDALEKAANKIKHEVKYAEMEVVGRKIGKLLKNIFTE